MAVDSITGVQNGALSRWMQFGLNRRRQQCSAGMPWKVAVNLMQLSKHQPGSLNPSVFRGKPTFQHRKNSRLWQLIKYEFEIIYIAILVMQNLR